MIKLTVLGSGSYQPELNRHSAAHLIQIGRQNIVFDFGRGALDQLMKLGINYYDIDAIFISHTHPDHFSELGSFLHISLAEPGKGKFRKKEMTIYGPAGFKKIMEYFYRAFDLRSFKPKYRVKIREMKPGHAIKEKDCRVTAYPVVHSQRIKSVAYRLTDGRKIFAYSGDSADCPGLRKAVKNADLALIETSHPDSLPWMHLTAPEAGKIAQETGVKKLVLTHASPYYWQKFDLRKEAKKYFKGPVLLAKDLMKIEI